MRGDKYWTDSLHDVVTENVRRQIGHLINECVERCISEIVVYADHDEDEGEMRVRITIVGPERPVIGDAGEQFYTTKVSLVELAREHGKDFETLTGAPGDREEAEAVLAEYEAAAEAFRDAAGLPRRSK